MNFALVACFMLKEVGKQKTLKLTDTEISIPGEKWIYLAN